MSANDLTVYGDDDLLAISGLQHFSFCRRQWALIHIEQQWQENLRTVEGRILHDKAHDAFFTEKRGNVLISRGMAVMSRSLGVSGVCDVVELHAAPDGVPIFGREGKWLPIPVEYKRGSPKENDADRLQLCCQAMCLEEMLCCEIPEAYLYYGEPNRRSKVLLDDSLRQKVRSMLLEIHDYYRRQYTPRVKPFKSCRACSLKDLCLPKLCRGQSAKEYLNRALHEGYNQEGGESL